MKSFFGFMFLLCGIEGKQLISLDSAIVTTNGTEYSNWSINRIKDGKSGDPNSCGCCTAIERPVFIQLDLRRPFLVAQIDIIGRLDASNTGQFEDIQVAVGLSPETLKTCEFARNGTNQIHVIQPYFPAAKIIRIIGLGQQGASYMTVCEINVYQQTEWNIIRPDMISTQSETYNECLAEKAIDGKNHVDDYNNELLLCSICSVTVDGQNPTFTWWQVDIGVLVLAHSVKIYGRIGDESRTRQSTNLQIYIRNATLDSSAEEHVGIIINSGVADGALLFFNLKVFRYLKITHSLNVLTLCEVEVYHAECPPGKYNLLCEACGHCKDSVCDNTTGQCTRGCDAGWQLAMCDSECVDGKFGINCNFTCNNNCLGSRPCNKTDGVCIGGCNPGYNFTSDQRCSSECADGSFGLNCSHACSKNCADSNLCNKTSGYCFGGCRSGYDFERDPTCNTECVDGKFGVNCNFTCSKNCLGSRPCNKADGVCFGGCNPGYDFTSDLRCSSACTGLYGVNCTRLCSENCRNKETCNNVNGECPSGCVDGYDFAKDKTCSLPCTGLYGVNCTRLCSENCLNKETCNYSNGECPSGCVDGYDYAKDKTCSSPCLNSYGRNCNHACSTNCLNNDICNSTNGECPNGCAVGYNSRIDRKCKTPQLESVTVLQETRSEVMSITHRAFETMPGWSTTSPLSANQKETNNDSTASLFAAIGALSMACGLLVATNVITFCIYLRQKKRTTASAAHVHSGTDNAYDTLSSAERSSDNYEDLQMAQI